MTGLLRDVFKESGRLGLGAAERILLILVAALALVLAQRVKVAISGITLDVRPQPLVDEGGIVPPAAPGAPDYSDPASPGGDSYGG